MSAGPLFGTAGTRQLLCSGPQRSFERVGSGHVYVRSRVGTLRGYGSNPVLICESGVRRRKTRCE